MLHITSRRASRPLHITSWQVMAQSPGLQNNQYTNETALPRIRFATSWHEVIKDKGNLALSSGSMDGPQRPRGAASTPQVICLASSASSRSMRCISGALRSHLPPPLLRANCYLVCFKNQYVMDRAALPINMERCLKVTLPWVLHSTPIKKVTNIPDMNGQAGRKKVISRGQERGAR